MPNRFEQCAFYSIINNGNSRQKIQAFETMCRPYCEESCPVLDQTVKTGLNPAFETLIVQAAS